MDRYTLVDTALKIGLGAFISGIATYLTTKLNADKEKEKFILEHRIKTIELASEKIEEYFDALSMLCWDYYRDIKITQ